MTQASTELSAGQDAEALVFSAKLEPNRSLGRRGTVVVLGGVATVGLLVSIPFYLLGAWPVFGFFGLDVLALYIAFRVCHRRALAYEELILTRAELLYRKVSDRGSAAEWRFNPFWVRLHSEELGEFGLKRLALVEGRRSLIVASCLGAQEKAEFAGVLRGALLEATRR